MWSWNQFRNLPKNKELSVQEQARQYFIHQSNMMMESSSNNNSAAAASSAAGAGAGAGGSRKKEFVLTLTFDDLSNADILVGDSSNVVDWNLFFDLPNLGNPFNSVEISGTVVNLKGGSNIKAKPGLMYGDGNGTTFLLKLEDTGCITSVGGDAFSYCNALTDVVLPECLILYGYNDSPFEDYGAFSQCIDLVNISAPKLEIVDESCFSHCESLTSISLPNLITVGYECFYNCYSLEIINIPLCTNLGGSLGYEYVFYGIEGKTIEMTLNKEVIGDSDIVELSLLNTIIVNGSSYQPFTGYSGNLTIHVVPFNIINGITDLEGWNEFFDLPSWSTPFTSLVTSGWSYTLIGGENIFIRENMFASLPIIEIIDQGCVCYTGSMCFSNIDELTTITFPRLKFLNNGCLQDCTSLVSVGLPQLVAAGDSCFYNCTSLTTIDLPSLITADYQCFADCDSLTTIDLPQLTTAGEYCFQNTELATIDLPTLITAGYQCFSNCSLLTTINLPKLVTAGEGCFIGCESLTEISIPLCTDLGGSVLNNNVFNYIGRMNIILEVNPLLLTCNNGGLDGDLLTLSYNNTITINGTPYQPFTGYSGDLTLGFDNITDADSLVGDSSSIEDWNLFFELPGWSTEFTDLVINEDEVTLIGGENIVLLSSLFKFSNIVSLVDQGCIAYIANNCFEESSLVTIDLPQLTTAGDSCFYNCTSLTTIDLPQLVAAGESCFYNCTSLTTIDLPQLVAAGQQCFYNCTALTTIDCTSLTNAGQQCFYNCTALTTIDLPQLTTTGYQLFYSCTSLTDVSLPAITSADYQCFYNCTALTDVSLPQLVTAGDSCFEGCSSLEIISLPSLTSTGYQCFLDCTALTEISIPLCTDLGDNALNNNVFFGIVENTILLEVNPVLLTCNNGGLDGDLVVLGYINDITINGIPYQPFTGYSGDLTLGFDDISDANTLVGDATLVSDWNTFFDLRNWSTPFSSVSVVGNDVTLIGGENIGLKNNKFESVTTLVSVNDQGCIAYIGSQCFSFCTSLTTVTFPMLQSIDSNCFFSCTSLTTVTFPLLQSAGAQCFYFCTSLTTVTFPLLQTAADNCFSACSSLETISLPEIQSVGGQCFLNCSSLETIILPKLQSVGTQCFTFCTSLTTVTFPLLQSAGAQCFNFCTSLTTVTLPSCIELGGGVGNNDVFSDISGKNIELTIPVALMTCNNGQPDGDIQILQANNTVTIITT